MYGDRLLLIFTSAIFNEGYTASSGDQLIRGELCAEAIRLGRLLVDLMPDELEALGLLALRLPTESRRPARTGPSGELVLLANQDRDAWDPELVAEGQGMVRKCLRLNRPGAPNPGGHQCRAQRRGISGGDRLAVYSYRVWRHATP